MYYRCGEDVDPSDPSKMTFRKIGFEFDYDQRSVTNAFRHAWTLLPPTPDFTVTRKVIRDCHAKTEEEKSQTPRNPDTRTVHTPLRDSVYYMFNHLFYDVGHFTEDLMGIGPFKPPNHDVFAVDFPLPDQTGDAGRVRALTKVWDTDVLVVPAYLAPGVAVRVETATIVEDGVVKDKVTEREKFSHNQPGHGWIFYIVKGVETHFYVETTGDVEVDGLAAVMVYGKMENQGQVKAHPLQARIRTIWERSGTACDLHGTMIGRGRDVLIGHNSISHLDNRWT